MDRFHRYAPACTYGPNDPNSPDAIAPEFDPYDGDLLHDLCGKHIGAALEDLFIRLRLHEMSKGSFGPEFTSDKVTVEYLVPAIQELRNACRKQFEEEK